MFVVMCKVSGGYTGTREAELKDKDGGIRYFDTREEAEAEATRLTAQMNGNKYRTATFAYWAETAEGRL